MGTAGTFLGEEGETQWQLPAFHRREQSASALGEAGFKPKGVKLCRTEEPFLVAARSLLNERATRQSVRAGGDRNDRERGP